MSKRVNLEGQQIGDWKVLKKVMKKGSKIHSLYKCLCKCGKEDLVFQSNLLNNHSRSCRECSFKNRLGKHIKWILSPVLGYSRAGANARGITFSISNEYATQLMEQQRWKCAITQTPLFMKRLNRRDYETNVSLDRIDSKKPYIKGNVQWVYKPINMMKWVLDQKEFIELCHLVAEKNPKIL